MSQPTTSKCAIPPNRGFQRTNIASFTKSRRQRFLTLRKQNRESYFENARKIALNADKHDEHQSPDSKHTKIQPFDFSLNAFTHYPPNKEENTHPMPTDPQRICKENPSKSSSNDADNTSHKKKKKKKKKKNTDNEKYRKERLLLAKEARKKYVDMFMVHEWMIDIPEDLTQNWLVGLRAEGERCLVFSNGGRTVSRNRSGNFIHNRFPSSLPAGNYVQQKKSSVTILDCIWIKNINTYYVIDCLLWSDQKIGSSDASMRLWFIKSKLKECWNIDTISKYNKYRFICIDTMDITLDNMQYLYNGGNLLNNNKDIENGNDNKCTEYKKDTDKTHKRVNYEVIGVDKTHRKQWYKIQPDGFIFYHKNGCYVQSLSCPLILIWKDEQISRWFIDTSNRQNKNKLLQFVSLELRKNATITTHEEDVVLGVMTKQNIEKYHFKAGELLRFSITNAVMNECRVDNLLYIKRCSMSKMQSDSWSKIIFQHQAKHAQSVRFDDIVNAVRYAATHDDDNDDINDKCNDNIQNIEDELRIATLGLSNFHL